MILTRFGSESALKAFASFSYSLSTSVPRFLPQPSAAPVCGPRCIVFYHIFMRLVIGKFAKTAAPLGDPIEITVLGYELSLRKADAESIEVE